MPRDLGQLDRVEWSTLEHAYGRATDTPRLLRALAQADEAARTDARYWLRASLAHQGTRYSASAAAVPFLVGLALDLATPERGLLLDLLADLAVGDADAWLDAAHPEEHAAHDAVLHESAALTGLLDDAAPAVRAGAARVLAMVPARAAELSSLALARVRDPDPGVRASMLLAAHLADRARSATSANDALTSALGDSDGRVSAVAASLLLASPDRGRRLAAMTTLAALLTGGLSSLAGLPFRGGDVERFVIDALTGARTERHEALRDALFAVVERGPTTALPVGPSAVIARAAFEPLAFHVFDRLPPRGGWSRDGASPAIQRFVRALADRPWLATPDGWAIAEANGVPVDSVRLAAWLGEPHTPSILDQKIAVPQRGLLVIRGLVNLLAAGEGGSMVVHHVDGATFSFTARKPEKVREAQRRVARSLATLPTAVAVDAVFALAAELGVSLEALLPAIDAVAANDGAGALAAATAHAERQASLGPPVTYERRGMVLAYQALVALLALATRAAAQADLPVPDVFEQLAPAAWTSDAFTRELVRWLERCEPTRRARWLEAQARSFTLPWPGLPALSPPGAEVLAQIATWLDDDAFVHWLPRAAPLDLLAALSAERMLAIFDDVLARLDAYLIERARWRADSLDEELLPLAGLIDAKGPAVVRAIAERRVEGGGSPELARLFEAVLASHHRAAIATPKQSGRGRGKKARPGASPARGSDDPLLELSHAAVDLVLAEPFIGHLLGRIDRVVTEATPTVGLFVGRERVALMANPRYFVETLTTRRQRVGVLKHEVLHLLFGHPFRTDLSNVSLPLLGAAADLVVNEHLGDWPLPSDAIQHPYEAGPMLVPGGTLDAYYDALLHHRAGRLEQGASSLADEPSIHHSDHRFWRRSPGAEADDGDLAARRAASGYVDELIENAYRAAGDEPLYGLTPALAALVIGAMDRRRATIAWRRVLRLFAAASRRTVVTHTLKRPSRRYGTLPGLRVRRRHRLAIAVDTSGSVQAATLAEFFSEIDAIHRTGSEIVIVECDAKVQRAYAYSGTMPDVVEGRGGTAFEPVLAWLHRPDVGQFDACIYLTDGQGPAPTTRPPCRLLWVVTNTGSVGAQLRFGRAIRMAG